MADNGVAKPTTQSATQPEILSKEQLGSGLIGMQERLVDFQGIVELIQTPAGCTLKIQVEDNYD